MSECARRYTARAVQQQHVSVLCNGVNRYLALWDMGMTGKSALAAIILSVDL